MARKSSDPKGQNKPVLVYVNEFGIRNSIHKLQEIILPAVRIVQQEFERLRLGPISDAYLKDLLFNDMFYPKGDNGANRKRNAFYVFTG